MATPPRSAALWSLRPPRSRPMGVRAPATMTEVMPDMGDALLVDQADGPSLVAVPETPSGVPDVDPVSAPVGAGRTCSHERTVGDPRPPLHRHRPRRCRRT